MTILWLFSYTSFVKFHGKKIGRQNMILLFLNPCNNEVYYKGTTIWATDETNKINV